MRAETCKPMAIRSAVWVGRPLSPTPKLCFAVSNPGRDRTPHQATESPSEFRVPTGSTAVSFTTYLRKPVFHPAGGIVGRCDGLPWAWNPIPGYGARPLAPREKIKDWKTPGPFPRRFALLFAFSMGKPKKWHSTKALVGARGSGGQGTNGIGQELQTHWRRPFERPR